MLMEAMANRQMMLEASAAPRVTVGSFVRLQDQEHLMSDIATIHCLNDRLGMGRNILPTRHGRFAC